MRRLGALFLMIWIPLAPFEPSQAGEPKLKPSPMMRAAGCARDGYSKINDAVVEHYRCPDGARVLVPRPELSEIPRSFSPPWRKWPDETEV